MKKIKARFKSKSYHLLYEDGLLDRSGDLIKKYCPADFYVIITSPRLKKKFGRTIEKALQTSNLKFKWITISDDEKNKNLKTVEFIYDKLANFGASKNSALVALGGGATQDICNYVAATFKRGLGFVQVPTTLLSQADIGFGGCAINHAQEKSLIGTFYQPGLALIDVSLTKTLPKKHISSGIAEIINKVGCLSKNNFGELKKNISKLLELDTNTLEKYVILSNRAKLAIIQKDETGNLGHRYALVFGHTFADALEKASEYKMTHGEAVAIGMYAAALLSYKSKLLSEHRLIELRDLLQKSHLPIRIPANINGKKVLANILRNDDSRDTNKIRFVLLKDFGEYFLGKVDRDVVEEVVDFLTGKIPRKN